ncbi:hypothetical protein BYT27DRAFT_7216333 [Phlegmacium glaucopus]|nr:hypothetical protein BYT27DRAFT_7216333 [Phlegmacium glaucopus]
MSWPSDKTRLASPPLRANLPFAISQCLHAMIKNSKIYAQKFRVLEARPVVGHAKLMRDLEECRTELQSFFLKLQAKLRKLQDRAHWLRDTMQETDQEHRKRISEMEKDVATVEILEDLEVLKELSAENHVEAEKPLHETLLKLWIERTKSCNCSFGKPLRFQKQ